MSLTPWMLCCLSTLLLVASSSGSKGSPTIRDGDNTSQHELPTFKVMDYFDHSKSLVLGPGDALVLVDFWETRPCPRNNLVVNALARRISPLLNLARRQGVRVFHALSRSRESMLGRDNRISPSQFWITEDRLASDLMKQSKALMERVTVARRPPVPIASTPGCPTPRNMSQESTRLNPRIEIQSRDVMFDAGYFFGRMARQGIKRVYYTGISLVQCVLFTRKFSALEALLSGQFESVGIIIDLTVATFRPSSDGCISDDGKSCADTLTRWMKSAFELDRETRQLRFWRSSII